MKKLNQLLILGTTLLLSAAALTGCSGSSAMGATIPQTTSGETATPQTDAGIIASETTGSNNRLNEILERGYIEIATEPYFAPRPTQVLMSNLQSTSARHSVLRSA